MHHHLSEEDAPGASWLCHIHKFKYNAKKTYKKWKKNKKRQIHRRHIRKPEFVRETVVLDLSKDGNFHKQNYKYIVYVDRYRD